MRATANPELDRRYAEHGSEQAIVRVSGPRMRVGARWLRVFWSRGETESQHRLPRRELFDVAVAEPCHS